MAGGILAVLPPIILAFLFQRYIISGMTAGAVEG
jgi:multiple sugar transport system permease protein